MKITKLEQKWIDYIESYSDTSLKKAHLISVSHLVFKLINEAKKEVFDDLMKIPERTWADIVFMVEIKRWA